jgi:hypothetical protein
MTIIASYRCHARNYLSGIYKTSMDSRQKNTGITFFRFKDGNIGNDLFGFPQRFCNMIFLLDTRKISKLINKICR